MNTWNLPVSDEAREALEAAGVTDIPGTVTLLLRTASSREADFIEAAQQPDGLLGTDPDGFYTELVRRRADPPVSAQVAREVVRDMPQAEKAELMFAYIQGERGHSKKIQQALSATTSGLTDRMLDALVETWPSSPTSTAPTT